MLIGELGTDSSNRLGTFVQQVGDLEQVEDIEKVFVVELGRGQGLNLQLLLMRTMMTMRMMKTTMQMVMRMTKTVRAVMTRMMKTVRTMTMKMVPAKNILQMNNTMRMVILKTVVLISRRHQEIY
jgi:hypothetical protein